ncbi:MAG: hypothetical protein K2X11_03350, partial [Acetobacteraceae bacterium]|nr:hypothetical protein [Acetobacteraceae bacterium]
MSLDLAFGIARSGLLATQRSLAQSSENLAQADIAGHTRKALPVTAGVSGGASLGPRIGEARREVDQALLAERDARGADAAAAGLRERLLSRIEAMHGRPGEDDSLAGVIGRLREAFVALRGAPAEAGLQLAAANAARDVAARFNDIGVAVARTRQEAQDGILEEVRRVNDGLRRIGDLTVAIRHEVSHGRSAAALEDERDLALAALSESLPVRALRQPDGGLVLMSRGGLTLPLDPGHEALATTPAAIGPDAFHGPGGTLPAVLLGGIDVTRQLLGGRLGEYVALRDGTLPRFQAELDVAASQLAHRLDAQGLRLFTDAGGAVPQPALGYRAGGQLGFANGMRLAADVAADPALLRDGTHDVPDDPAGPAAFRRNAPGGPAGFTTLLGRVLDHALGPEVRPGLGWGAMPGAGLGPDETLASPFVPPRDVEAYAATIAGAHSAE